MRCYGFINRKKLPGPVNGKMMTSLFVPITTGFVTFIQFVVVRSAFCCSTKLLALVGQVNARAPGCGCEMASYCEAVFQ